MSYYVLIEGQAVGPVDAQAVRDWLDHGRLTPEDLGCRVGEEQWRPLRTLEELWTPGETRGSGTPGPSGGPRPSGAAPTGGRVLVGESFSRGGAAFSRAWGCLAGLSALVFVASVLAGAPGQVAQQTGSPGLALVSMPWSIGLNLLVVLPLGVAAALAGLQAVRGGDPRVGDCIAQAYGRLGPLALYWLLIAGLTLLAIIALAIVGGIGAAILAALASASGGGAMHVVIVFVAAVAIALLIVGALRVSVGLMPGWLLVADPAFALGPVEALRTSWTLTAPQWGRLVLLLLLGGLVLLLTTIACLVPLVLVGYPLWFGTLAAAYDRLTTG